MFINPVLDIWSKNKAVINGWLSIPNSFTAEAMSKMGWDSLTIDMQHGQNDYLTSISMLQAISQKSAVPFVRVPWNEAGIIMRMLDAGVCGIIAPMINTRNECEQFVSYCRYPPMGIRSFGPMRAQLLYGSDYFQKANSQIVTLAMIETQEAINNLDEILSGLKTKRINLKDKGETKSVASVEEIKELNTAAQPKRRRAGRPSSKSSRGSGITMSLNGLI